MIVPRFERKHLWAWGNRDDFDQTVHMHSLITVFPVCISNIGIVNNLYSSLLLLQSPGDQMIYFEIL